MRVLIDGMDLTGKTTLAWRLAQDLERAGVPVTRQAGAVDALFGPACEERLVLQEGGLAHAAVQAKALGRGGAAAVMEALQPWWPTVDFRVYLRASRPTLLARYRLRDHNDAVDTLLLTDPDRFMAMEAELTRRMRRAGAMVLQVDEMTPSEVVAATRPWIEDLWWARQAARLRARPALAY